jgi:hypothetical protein
MSDTRSSPGGRFLGLLLLLFIGLKLTGHIDWSWLWVLAPLWGPVATVVLVVLCGVLFIAAAGITEHNLGEGSIDWQYQRHYWEAKIYRWWHGEPQDPVSWARIEKPNYHTKITLIKEIRAEFGMKLKEAKSVADKVW